MPLARLWRAVAVAVTAGVVMMLLPAGHATAAERRDLLLIAVPDLLWSDVDHMPTLHTFTTDAQLGNLSVKSLSSVTRCGDGLLELSAGARVGHAPEPCDVDTPSWEEARQRNLDGPFAAQFGAFGQALQDAGLRVATVGGPARLMLEDRSRHIDRDALDESDAFAAADVVGIVLPALFSADGPDRAAVAGRVDRRIAELIAGAPTAAVTAVVGVSDGATGRAQLHVLAVRDPASRAGALTTVRRPPYLQLIDVAPTLLAHLHVPVPAAMDGDIATVDGPAPSIADLVDANRHATSAAPLGSATRLVLWLTTLLLALLWMAWTRQPRLLRAVRTLAWPLAFAPVLTYLVQVVPWWRHGHRAFLALVVGAALVAGAAGALLSARWRLRRGVVFLPAAFTFLVLVADQLAGAPLQFCAPMGDNPLVAGRFRGMGNTAFAMMTTAAVLLMGVLIARYQEAGRPRSGLVAAAAVGAVALVIDGAPMIGDDFGGMLALLPVVAAFLVVATGVRLTALRIAMVAVGAALVVIAVAVGDYLRPADAQTHIGRFVGDVLHGGGGHVIARKARASGRSFTNVPAVLATVGAVAAVALTRRRLWPAGRVALLLPATGWMLLALAVLGTALNDSGVVVAAFVAAVAVPALVLAATQPVQPSRTQSGNDATPAVTS